MTTHDEQTKTVKTSTEDDAAASRPESSEEMEPSTARTDPSADAPPTHGEALTTGDEPSTARTEPSQMGTEPSSEPSDARSLFADEDLSGLRSRWDDVQAAFVDSPKDCVQKADTLVAEVVEQPTPSGAGSTCGGNEFGNDAPQLLALLLLDEVTGAGHGGVVLAQGARDPLLKYLVPPLRCGIPI